MKKGDVFVLKHILKNIEDYTTQLEKFYSSRDYENFNKTKKLILELNKQLKGVLK
jgi:hypothetical protein